MRGVLVAALKQNGFHAFQARSQSYIATKIKAGGLCARLRRKATQLDVMKHDRQPWQYHEDWVSCAKEAFQIMKVSAEPDTSRDDVRKIMHKLLGSASAWCAKLNDDAISEFGLIVKGLVRLKDTRIQINENKK